MATIAKSLIGNAGAADPVQAAQEQEAGGAGGAAADGRTEFKEMFISLVDPAGLVDMDACRRTAGLMEEAASRSGYAAGAKMASILAGIFAGVAEIAGRPVDDGAMGPTDIAYRDMMVLLYDTAEAYGAGDGPNPKYCMWRPRLVECSGDGDVEPIAEMEGVRRRVARERSRADRLRKRLRAADPPGSGLPRIDMPYCGRICRDVVREEQEEIRARDVERGHDPVFPPMPEIPWPHGDADPSPSAVEIALMAKGNIPDGYELVRVADGNG